MTTVISDSYMQVVIEVPPVPAARPRVSKWGTYYPATYKDWKKAAAAFFHPASPCWSDPVFVELEIICKRPQRITNPIPPGDVDNYAKAALDAVNDAHLWLDDKQVVSLNVSKRYAEKDETPRTIIHIHRKKAA